MYFVPPNRPIRWQYLPPPRSVYSYYNLDFTYTCFYFYLLIQVFILFFGVLVELVESPLCLRVKVPLKYTTKNVLLCVDPRVGNIVASIDPPSDVNGVQTCLEELEKTVTSNWSTLPAQLLKLQ